MQTKGKVTGIVSNLVNVTIDGERFSVHPETLDSFFNSEVLPRLQ